MNTWISEGDIGPWEAMAEVARLAFPDDGGTGLLSDVVCVAAQRFMKHAQEMPPEQLVALENLLKAAAEYREWDVPASEQTCPPVFGVNYRKYL